MPTTTNLNTLTINHVASQEVYDAMAAQNLINENELYLVPGDISIATDDTPGGTENSEALITSGAAYAGFQTKANKQNAIYFVKGTQTAKTGSWRGVLSAVNELYDGLTIAYLLPVAGDGSATLTLELGNSVETAAEPIYYTGTTRLTTHYGAGSIILLTWVSNATTGYAAVDGATGSWRRADYDSTITYRLTNYYGLYKAYTVLYRYQICLTKNETSVLPINTVSNSTATTKTLTTESFNPFGPIYYYNTTTTISSGGNIGSNTLAYQYLADLRYSFNTGTTLTARKAVYLIATLGEGCSATLKPGNQPITQTLPTTDDGYIYIYLGQAHDTCKIELSVHHPIYQYKNGALRTVSADYMVNGHTVEADVPSDAVFTDTDTTYSFESGNNGSIKVINNLTSAEQTVSIYSLPLATSAERGGVKIGYTANGKNYPVQLSNEKMYVNVPWTNVNDAYLTEDDVSPTLPTPTLA